MDTCVGNTGTDKYDILYAKEFRYDGARQRYLSRALVPSRLEDGVIESLTSQVIWSDYDGDDIYGDFTVAAGVATQVADYEPGVGRSYSPGVASATMYYHQDLLGSSRMMTNASQSQLERQWYSAFGESGNAQVSQRYGYAGAWGYQTDTAADGFPFMHLGARYYDPATGRFLQRDPIGIRGGLNVYAYVRAKPTVAIDPAGTDIWDATLGREGTHSEWAGESVREAMKPPPPVPAPPTPQTTPRAPTPTNHWPLKPVESVEGTLILWGPGA